MEQCLFDELVLFVLDTISSEEYLNSIGIYRPAKTNWETFIKKVNKQTIQPGIYPRHYNRYEVHYFAVRQEPDGKLTVGNGYPTIACLNKNYAIGLNAQPNKSHGLCQTFALMYYFNEEDRLIPGDYFNNVIIGFKFLQDFIKADYNNRERCWEINELIEYMQKICSNHTIEDRIKNIRKFKKGEICLSDLIKQILNPKYQDNLHKWFYMY
jgi:hypothetical protein